MPHRHGHRADAPAHFSQDLRNIFHRDFVLVTLINFIVSTAYYLQFVTGAAYARDAFHLSLSLAGFSSGIIVVGSLTGRFFASNLISLLGCKNLLLCGVFFFALSMALFFSVGSVPALFADRFLLGIGTGITATATATIVACIVPVANHGLGISIFSMSTVLALAFGPLLGMSIMRDWPFATQVAWCLGASCICMAGVFLLGKISGIHRKARPLFKLNSYIDPRVVGFSVSAMLFSASYGCVQVFLPTFAADRGLTASASVFFICYGAAALCTRPVTGRLYDQFGENLVLPPLFLAGIASLCLLAFAHSPLPLLLGGLGFGLGFGNYQSVAQATAISYVTRSRFAQATTTFYIFFDFGLGVAPFVYGMLIPGFGYEGMFLALAVTAAIGLMLFFLLRRK